MDGGNVKLARQTKTSVQAPASVGDGGEEAGTRAAMGLLKRKWTTPPESPAPSKRRTVEEAELRISSSTEAVEGGTPSKIQAGKSLTPSQDAAATRVKQSSGQSNNGSTMSELTPEEVARLRFEKDVDALQSRTPSFVENVSHGQGTSSSQAGPPPETSGPAVALTKDCEAQSPATPHLVPSHAGWFQWGKVHPLEKVALPEFFSSKEDAKKTPETYMEHRSCVMKKYRENPQKMMKFDDVRELLTGDVSGAVRLFGFLDHWGLINYQAITEFSPPSQSSGLVGSAADTLNGAVTLSPLVKPALANLFNFEAPAIAPAHKQVSIGPSPASNLPISSLAEAAVQESLAAPAVEYHCNSCQADCSKRRYHCQKQADFDLCPDCYSDGKFGEGMSGTDFLRMDALTGNADVNGGGWSDQETLLLLEALELYGDNWNEIAEHVATKSKAQCILHFIRLPIEDPFLEVMESSKSVVTVQPPSTVESTKQTASPPTDKGVEAKGVQDENPSSTESLELVPSNPEPKLDPAVPKEKGEKDGEPSSLKAEEKEKEKEESDISDVIKKENDSKDVHPLLAIAECAGCAGPDGLIAFVDAGNPVMTQVAFLAAMVGPRVAAAAAQAALKSLAEDDPVGFLSAKNSFALDGSDTSDKTLASAVPESGHQSTETQLVSSTGLATVSSDGKSTSKSTEEATTKENANEKVVAGTFEKASGQEAPSSQKSPVKAPTNSQIITEQDVPSVAKVRTAAANALASAAVKAKLLADQEEREIQRLVAGVIENQLKKLELKLKHFSELESMLGKECEQAEKARAKVYAERARIVASRLGSPPNMQSAGSTAAASYPKISSHPTNSVAQPKPAAFNFGPTAASAPSAAASTTTSALESSSSVPASSSSQQGVPPQRLPIPRPVPGTSLASGAKE